MGKLIDKIFGEKPKSGLDSLNPAPPVPVPPQDLNKPPTDYDG